MLLREACINGIKYTLYRDETGLSLRTPRILLRPFEHDDADELLDLWKDDEVMKYSALQEHRRTSWTRNTALSYIRLSKRNWVRNGFGMWAAYTIDTHEFVGFASAEKTDISGDIRFGVFVHKRFWSRGFTTEVAWAVLDTVFKFMDANMVSIATSPANAAVYKIVRGLGFVPGGSIIMNSFVRQRFFLTKAAYLIAAG